VRVFCLVLCLFVMTAVCHASAGVPVLIYHHVDYGTSIYSVTPERLERDLQQLKGSGYQTITLAALRQYVEGRGTVPEKAVVITFDDGFADQYTDAFPLLVRYGMTAVFFVTVGDVGSEGHMSAIQMITMAKTGMEFGSHTIRHQLLPTLDDVTLRDEVFGSRRVLAGVLGIPVTAFAFPGGNLDFRVVQSVHDGGYLMAFSTNIGLCTPSSAIYVLPRIPVFSYTKGVLREIGLAADTPLPL
jgi:peptidoglycan/xylan/chitin deacetylase (PgdA/CDA1 family)